MARICKHCHNPIEEIQYKEEGGQMGYGTMNEFKHGRPRPYPICGKNPLTSEDVLEEEDE